MTLAPKYPADTHPMWLVRDFYQGIEQLVGNGQLDAASAFVREARSTLENYLYALGESSVERPEDFVGPSLQMTALPTTPVEGEIAAVMAVAFRRSSPR